MNSVQQIAERIKGLRTLVGKTPEQMAEEIGVSTAEYHQAEAGTLDFAFTFLVQAHLALTYLNLSLVSQPHSQLVR